MFTGIVEGTGIVRAMRSDGRSGRLTVDAGDRLRGTRMGDSIAVNGVCLTVATMTAAEFEADLSAETLARTTLGDLRPGDAVNLERPLAVGDRLGGHLVQGHVDGVGRVTRRGGDGDAPDLEIAAPRHLARYIVEKGSIAVDGVSLTVAAVSGDRFTVCLIPHTSAVTTVGVLEPGDAVNIEIDVLAKYVERLIASYAPQGTASQTARASDPQDPGGTNDE